MTGEEIMIISDLLRNKHALIPITVTEFGMFGSLFNCFLFGDDALQLPPFTTNQKNANAAAEHARSKKVPRGITQPR